MESGGDGLGRKGGERESTSRTTHGFLNLSKHCDTKCWGNTRAPPPPKKINHYELRHEQFDHIVVDCTEGGCCMG